MKESYVILVIDNIIIEGGNAVLSNHDNGLEAHLGQLDQFGDTKVLFVLIPTYSSRSTNQCPYREKDRNDSQFESDRASNRHFFCLLALYLIPLKLESLLELINPVHSENGFFRIHETGFLKLSEAPETHEPNLSDSSQSAMQ